LGRKRQGRRVDGILVVNKPAGMTSNGVLQRVKGIYFAVKAGHTGSLDPLATGVLPICFGEATKVSQFLLDADKAYEATVVFGVATDTGDADGEVVRRCDAAGLDLRRVDEALARFVGTIEQVPPMYSALKHGGVPLYEFARKGQEVQREAREVRIDELRRLDFVPGSLARLRIRVRCSKGTYVRTLAEDIGAALDCAAHVEQLHRSQAGPFGDSDAVELAYLEELRTRKAFAELDELLLPVSRALEHLPEVRVAESGCFYLSRGQAVIAPHMPRDGLVRIAAENGEFRGVGEILEDGRLAPRRMMAAG
jgi:tRNA pseudouridine55 synthase